ncbi:MAG: hypothetical protein MUF64_02810 [Polyangiaceae bacterium]|jgi:hypothetical protein|nr:hypothetical protein [Polyangiaceae bacterium]
MTAKAKSTLFLVLALVTGHLWFFGSGFMILAAITLASTGPNPVNWPGLFVFIGATGLVPLGLLVAASATRKG